MVYILEDMYVREYPINIKLQINMSTIFYQFSTSKYEVILDNFLITFRFNNHLVTKADLTMC